MESLIEPRQNDETTTTTTNTNTTNDGGGSNNTTNNTPLLVSFGNPLLDITAVVKDNELHHRFCLPIDGQLEVDDTQRPVFSHVMEKYPVEYTAGGCALNSSRVFCWVLGEPHHVVFVGGIGKDEAARRLSDIVEESGVITRFVKVDDQPTGVCVALVLGACRCLCADIGAAATCLPHHVFAPHLTPVLEEAEFIYVEGYFITHSFPAALQVKAALRQHPTQHSAPRQHEAREPAGHSLERLVLTSTVSLKPCAGGSEWRGEAGPLFEGTGRLSPCRPLPLVENVCPAPRRDELSAMDLRTPVNLRHRRRTQTPLLGR